MVGSTNDGIPEALESEDGLVFAVQWHPEELYNDYPVFKGLFTRLIDLASQK
ncbi:gamma-glutamyl-gamma-aminobutyrate hydrolase family protein [Ruminococcus callidus]|uniref:gamma-glutamyl-gamma-aminobutyrate hydrolase family protein n=1 Tax=Ruminococcus callidus TaxID=40519 RepID=UPI003C6DDF00